MRNGRCPKCGSARIATATSGLHFGGGVAGPSVQLFACAECRYVEQYLRDSVENLVAVLDRWEWLQPGPAPFR